MGEKDDDTLSRTVLQDAWEAGLDRNDPEVIALAKQAQKRKEASLMYKVTEKIKDAAPGMIVAVISFLGMTIGGIITAIIKGIG